MKTAISSTVCGTSTLKSPLLRAFFTPHVHPRLRKHPPRCTLDCGFQTSESPALRGFVGGSQALATAALYLVLKSNGLHCPKIWLKKFGFSLKIVPANIVQKLPSQRCSKPLFIPIFNFSHKRHTFAFTGESEYTLGFRRRIAHTGSHAETGAFPSANTAWHCAASEIFYSTTLLYTYISRFSVNPQHQQKRIIRQSCHHKFYPQPLFNFSYNRPTFAFTSESGHTLGSRRKIAHSGSHGETRGVSDGGAITTLGAFCTFTNIPGPGVRTAYLAPFGSWPRVLPKNAESLGTAMRLCASLLRGVAAPPGCVTCLQLGDVAVFSLCAQYFLNVRGGGGITTLGALCVLLKRWTAACQKGSFAVF